ncbi:MAG: 2Fe-2S iron-sulfur cluster-binding protein [Cyclobacteriaceae bacterium]|nr:2Fe-2S iron-sulfur cluster-binding protein [Cyclobacteriaceae bacterium]
MINLKINGKDTSVSEGSTLLDAIKSEGISVPTMCFLDNEEHFPTCMICIVKEEKSGKLVPSCSTRVSAGMEIITSDEEVIEARKTALELLLSDHIGECDAPCQVNCPAFMDIPQMNRLLGPGKVRGSIARCKERHCTSGSVGAYLSGSLRTSMS